MLLSDNGNLSEKNRFRSGIEKYYRYNKEKFDKLPPGMFYEVFSQLCDADMQANLGSVPNVELMTFDQL